MSRLLAALALIVAVAVPLPASAYFVFTCGDGTPAKRSELSLQFRTSLLTGGDPTLEFDEAIEIFNRNPTNFGYWPTIQHLHNYTPALNNGHSDVWSTHADMFSNDQFALVAHYFIESDPGDCWIVEGDVLFNLNYAWTETSAKSEYNAYGDDATDLSTPPGAVAALAAVTGFLRDCSTYNAMGDPYRHLWANGSEAEAYLGEDTVNGLVDLYGDFLGAPVLQSPDVAVTHWRHDGCVNGFAHHSRTEVFAVSGDVLGTVQGEQEPRFIAAAGQTIEPVFTLENLGNTLEEGVEIGFYWSPDDLLTTRDRRIGGATLDFVRNLPDTRRFSVDLPIDLDQGDGYLGVIVDETDTISEIYEANNMSYIGMRIEGTDLDGDGEPDGDGDVYFRYAAKVVCGRQEDGENLRLRPGVYGTTVNVFNPDVETVRFDKRLAVSFPPDPQVQGETHSLGPDSLDPLRALETNCDTLIEEAFAGAPPEPYFEGFVVITSPRSLDVTAVYTTSGLPLTGMVGGAGAGSPGAGGPGDLRAPEGGCRKHYCPPPCCGGCCFGGCCGGGNGGGGIAAEVPTIDVEQIAERKIKVRPPSSDLPDLVPEPPFPAPPQGQPGLVPQNYCLGPPGFNKTEELRVRVRNQGDADSGPSNVTVIFQRAGTDNALALETQQFLGLGPGDFSDHDFLIPDGCYASGGTPTSGCKFRIAVDQTPEQVVESDEANNTDASSCPGVAS